MTFTVFGGINGSGKSTIYGLLGDVEKTDLGMRINADEIVMSMGSWRDEELQIRAAKLTVQNINNCLRAKVSFNQETTLAGRSIIKTIKHAKELGYNVKLYYIFVDTVDIAKNRVLERVKKGGHGIPEGLIEQRFYSSLENLKLVIPFCDTIVIYNNTVNLTDMVIIENGYITYFNKDTPEFIINALPARK